MATTSRVREQVKILLEESNGQIVATSVIVETVWGPAVEGDVRACLRVHVHELRDYFRAKGFELVSVRGSGYQLQAIAA